MRVPNHRSPRRPEGVPPWLYHAPRPVAVVVWLLCLPMLAIQIHLSKRRQRKLAAKGQKMLQRWKREQVKREARQREG